MEIIFKNKETPNNIIKRAEEIKGSIPSMDNSFICKGDNFVVMAQLLANYRGKVDLVYIDPPFNTEQVFSVGDTRISTISRPKNGKVAYADTMTKDEYLRFIYDRFVLIHELLSDRGSLYVHIDVKMGHYCKVILDEIFGEENYKNDIARIKSNPKNFNRRAYGNQKDMILFYSKTKNNIWNDIRIPSSAEELANRYNKTDKNGRRYTTIPLHAPGESNGVTGTAWRGMLPPEGRHWRTDPAEFDKLDAAGLIEWSSRGNPRIIKYADEHHGKKIQDIWEFKDPQYPIYPTEKNLEMMELIVKQSSNKNSLVMDCFAGSGTTLLAAAMHNRKFIGIDKSEFSIETIKKRLAIFTQISYLNIE